MATADLLELNILSGEQAGAQAPISPGTKVTIGGDHKGDIFLRDPLVADSRFSLFVEDGAALIEVASGNINIDGKKFGVGATTKLSPYVPVKIGSTTLAFGIPNDSRWENIPDDEQKALRRQAGQRNSSLRPSLALEHKSENRSSSMMMWLIVVGAGLLGATMAVPALTGGDSSEIMQYQHTVHYIPEELTTTLTNPEYSELRVEETEAGEFVVRGFVDTRKQRMHVEKLLASTNSAVQLDITVDEQVAAAVRDVYRINGISAEVTPEGRGVMRVTTMVDEISDLHRVEAIARRDVAGLTNINADNHVPESANPASDSVISDPNKRIAAIVPGDPAYLVTRDGARYFLGAMFPTGHKIAAINEHNVVLDKDGQKSTLEF